MNRKQYKRKLCTLKKRMEKISKSIDSLRNEWLDTAPKPYPIGTIGVIKINGEESIIKKTAKGDYLLVQITDYVYDITKEDIRPVYASLRPNMTTSKIITLRFDEHFENDMEAVNKQLYLWSKIN